MDGIFADGLSGRLIDPLRAFVQPCILDFRPNVRSVRANVFALRLNCS